jgi:hypothetical protein
LTSQTETSSTMTSEQKSTLKLVFLTLFLDLMGFSIIFPLFPELAEYYWKNDPDNIFLQQIFNFINTFGRNPDSFQAIVLFGGILGALYSLLQFIASPFLGKSFRSLWKKANSSYIFSRDCFKLCPLVFLGLF